MTNNYNDLRLSLNDLPLLKLNYYERIGQKAKLKSIETTIASYNFDVNTCRLVLHISYRFLENTKRYKSTNDINFELHKVENRIYILCENDVVTENNASFEKILETINGLTTRKELYKYYKTQINAVLRLDSGGQLGLIESKRISNDILSYNFAPLNDEMSRFSILTYVEGVYNYSKSWLLNQLKENPNMVFLFFWGHTPATPDEIDKSCLSQWYDAPFTIKSYYENEKDTVYPTTEHWMMAQKAELFEDLETKEEILHAETPEIAKSLGRKIKNFDENVWNIHKTNIVVSGNRHKFDKNEKLKDFLLQTGDAVLVEASPVDTIWGIGLAQNDPNAKHPELWKGENLLGFALMKVRDYFQNKHLI